MSKNYVAPSDLTINTANNGFIVYSGNGPEGVYASDSWAFESPQSLAVFIEEWGKQTLESKRKDDE